MSRFTLSLVSLTLLLTCSWRTALSRDTQVNVTKVTVKPGEDATLECQADRDGSINKLAWRKTDLKLEKYVFFFRGNRSHENYQLDYFRGRVELLDPQMKEGHACLVLKNSTDNDSGTYECLVSTSSGGRRRKRAAPFRHIVHLKVEDSGPKAGGSEYEGNKYEGNKYGGNKDEGNKEGGNLHGHSGLIGLIATGLVISVVIGLMVKERLMKKKPEQPAADEQQQLSSPEPDESQRKSEV